MTVVARLRRSACLLVTLALALGWAAVAQGAEYRLLKIDGHLVKWASPALGTGATITYGFVESKRSMRDAINCGRLEPLAPRLARVGISRALLRHEVAEALRMWERAADITFRYVEDPAAADVLIGADGGRRGIAFANVWTEETAVKGVSSIRRAAVCLNPLVRWEIAFDGEADTFDIRRVIAHEIGHVLGLDHPGRTGQLMGFSYQETDRRLRPGDVKGAQALYGAPRERRPQLRSLPR